jgi:hypothetical protein
MRASILLSALLFLSLSFQAQFQSGDRVELTKPYPDDIYIAAGEIQVRAPIYGDCVIAGGNISINDSISGDLMVGGGDITIRGTIGDDIRVAGGTIEIDSEVMDDLIVFGGKINVTENAVIHGNVVSYGGNLTMDGTVLGAMKASGGEISIGGKVHGPMRMAAGSVVIKEGAQFFSDVSYWAENGKVDFGSSVQNGEATYDLSMAWEGDDHSASGTILGLGIFFMTMFILGGFLILLLLEWAFGRWFTGAAQEVVNGWSRSLGIGVLYVIGIPVLIVLSFVIVIGIPIGIFGLVLYIFSLLFGKFAAALVIAHLWKSKKAKTWGILLTSLIALMIAIGLQIVTSIPLLGSLLSFLVICITYGALVCAVRGRNSGPAETPLASTVSGLG